MNINGFLYFEILTNGIFKKTCKGR